MSRSGFVFIVVALLIGATIPALLTTTQTKGYPASPHYGNAYVGEFWLEEMNITLDTENSPGYDIAKMVKGHVRAQNDWIVYDANNSIVANYSIQIGDEHPKFNLLMWIEVYAVKSNFSTYVGGASQSIECQANRSYDIHGNISVPLSDINFTGGNLTLICSLKAVIYGQIQFSLNPAKNITYMVEDRSVVAVEESKNTDTDFSWYIDQADEYLPSFWKDVPDLQSGPPEAQTVWGVEQTVAVFMDSNLATPVDNGQTENTNVERPTWVLADFKVYSDLNNYPDDPPVWIKSKEFNQFMKWNATIEERDKGHFYGPATVNLTILPPTPGCIPVPIYLKWSLSQWDAMEDSGGGTEVWLYTPDYIEYYFGTGDLIWNSARLMGNGTIRVAKPVDGDDRTWPVNLKGHIRVNFQRFPEDPDEEMEYQLLVHFVNSSNNEGQNNTNVTATTYYPTWESAVLYWTIAESPISMTSITSDGVTTVEANIDSLVKDSNDVFIYIYGGDTGDYKVDVDG